MLTLPRALVVAAMLLAGGLVFTGVYVSRVVAADAVVRSCPRGPALAWYFETSTTMTPEQEQVFFHDLDALLGGAPEEIQAPAPEAADINAARALLAGIAPGGYLFFPPSAGTPYPQRPSIYAIAYKEACIDAAGVLVQASRW